MGALRRFCRFVARQLSCFLDLPELRRTGVMSCGAGMQRTAALRGEMRELRKARGLTHDYRPGCAAELPAHCKTPQANDMRGARGERSRRRAVGNRFRSISSALRISVQGGLVAPKCAGTSCRLVRGDVRGRWPDGRSASRTASRNGLGARRCMIGDRGAGVLARGFETIQARPV